TNAEKEPTNTLRGQLEKNFVFIGLVGIYLRDPPRPESRQLVVELCRREGIKVLHMLMTGGDHRLTAAAIACEVGILPTAAAYPGTEQYEQQASQPHHNSSPVRQGNRQAAGAAQSDCEVCTPDTKMIQALLHRRRCIVSMTGDGVNGTTAATAHSTC